MLELDLKALCLCIYGLVKFGLAPAGSELVRRGTLKRSSFFTSYPFVTIFANFGFRSLVLLECFSYKKF